MADDRRLKTVLIISQVYVPDPAAVGQYLADVGAEMARRGWRVVVLTADRGYDDPSVTYARRETIDGVEIRRLPFSSFGKRSIGVRLLGGVLFLAQVIVHGLFMRRLSRILVSTSPPMCPAAAVLIGALRRVSIKYWLMDLNPDQMVALGRLRAGAPAVRLFDAMNHVVLRSATDVVVLDRFMADRLVRKWAGVKRKLTVLGLWPLERHLGGGTVERDNPFRKKHGLTGKLVIMYSGNMSIASPLDTVLEAALRLQNERDVVFVFVGGGLGKKQLDAFVAKHQPTNMVSLPYEPLSGISQSLSAADVHLVAMGERIVGVCHPSKVYSAMAVGRPILLLGPELCHVSEMLEGGRTGWHVQHGDVDGMEATIRDIARLGSVKLAAMGDAARRVANGQYGRTRLCGKFCGIVEQAESREVFG